MKRLMFLIVSAFIATTSYCANVSDNIRNVLGNNDETTQIEKQKNQPLVLQKAKVEAVTIPKIGDVRRTKM